MQTLALSALLLKKSQSFLFVYLFHIQYQNLAPIVIIEVQVRSNLISHSMLRFI
jgi:hypothetical protein